MPFGSHAAALVLASAGMAVLALAVPQSAPVASIDVVTVAPGSLAYVLAGDFSRDGRVVSAPRVEKSFARPLRVMRRLVGEAEYAECVAAAACAPLDDADAAPRADHPATGLSWRDATAYAAWFSAKTGRRWRLPSDEEWARFAAEAWVGETSVAAESDDPSVRQRALYEAEAAREEKIDRAPKPFGAFGVNSHGLVDVSGNVWEWTDACWTRTVVEAGGAPRVGVNCGVRVVEGRHRGYVSDFVRDPRGGGCSLGVPPANLGVRLVTDDAP